MAEVKDRDVFSLPTHATSVCEVVSKVGSSAPGDVYVVMASASSWGQSIMAAGSPGRGRFLAPLPVTSCYFGLH